MRKLGKMCTLFISLTLISALFSIAKAQTSSENIKTFFDSEIPGIKIQVNATKETQPTNNITVILSLTGKADVYVEYLNLSIFGFEYGKNKTLMVNITENNFPLKVDTKEYNRTIEVPENVWDVTYGEISLTYSANLGGLELRFPKLVCGFTMTYVENVYLKTIEEQLRNLNQTYWELLQNYTALQGSLNELDNTRRVVAILAITTVFFVATTFYLVMRKPKEYW